MRTKSGNLCRLKNVTHFVATEAATATINNPVVVVVATVAQQLTATRKNTIIFVLAKVPVKVNVKYRPTNWQLPYRRFP